ncbi:MAG: hypothetical protein IE933_06040 [Sphingomonadales bacterium]|nr:hypothetical protein [Sphingomonadales bacterium]MBD3773742.1 hypothetical protein [Paracoccaceae bacterium]
MNYDESAPENVNREQVDRVSQAQEIAEQAKNHANFVAGATESRHGPHSSGIMGDSTQDTVDHMRDMESSGRIDMDAYRGEPNHDDFTGKFGAESEDDS